MKCTYGVLVTVFLRYEMEVTYGDYWRRWSNLCKRFRTLIKPYFDAFLMPPLVPFSPSSILVPWHCANEGFTRKSSKCLVCSLNTGEDGELFPAKSAARICQTGKKSYLRGSAVALGEPSCSDVWPILDKEVLLSENWPQGITSFGTCTAFVVTPSWVGCTSLRMRMQNDIKKANSFWSDDLFERPKWLTINWLNACSRVTVPHRLWRSD